MNKGRKGEMLGSNAGMGHDCLFVSKEKKAFEGKKERRKSGKKEGRKEKTRRTELSVEAI